MDNFLFIIKADKILAFKKKLITDKIHAIKKG